MSADTEFHAALLASAGLTALVGNRIAANAIEQTDAPPYVVYTADATPDYTLNDELAGTRWVFTVQAWAASQTAANAVADEIEDALDGLAVVLTRATGFDSEVGLDAAVLTVEWWD